MKVSLPRPKDECFAYILVSVVCNFAHKRSEYAELSLGSLDYRCSFQIQLKGLEVHCKLLRRDAGGTLAEKKVFLV